MACRAFARARSTPCCIGERLERGKKRLHPLPMPVAQLPDGAMVQQGEESFLIAQGRALRWSMAGYARPRRRNRRRAAADAALDAARAEGGISPGAASECDGIESLSPALSLVMPGLDRGHPRLSFLARQDVDGRVKPGHDGVMSGVTFSPTSAAPASRPHPAPPASLPRYRAASAPCRNWWWRRCCSSARISTPPRSP